MRQQIMGYGLRGLTRLANNPLLDRFGLRKRVEQLVARSVQAGFSAGGAAARTFSKTQKLLKPARPATARAGDSFNLTPTEEQQMLREAVQAFASEQLRGAAAAADTAAEAPDALFKQSNELGIAQLAIPEALGGTGGERSAITAALVTEAMAQGDMSLAVACLAPTAVSTALVLWGDEDQQATYLPAFAGENPPAAALAISEPRILFDPFALETKARRNGESYVIEGVKTLVPRAKVAELFIVAAELEGKGPALFIVEAKTAGIAIEAEPAMGLRAASTARVRFANVTVPASALIADGDAAIYTECIHLARLGWCSLAVGGAQAVLDYVIPYVNDRVAFGEPISHRQSVAFAVANMGIELDAMRLLTWRAASRAEHGKDFAQHAALARRLCVDKGMQIGNDGVQLLGGHGFIKEHPVERWYRDLRAVGVMEGVLLV
ncbi:MAG TPA: acyl-CoA dehydrogenase family protein [Nevskiaceae bacterium]|nr:acyl-CoA dehydrogenase family protein [Nevskiaceae bacterium]